MRGQVRWIWRVIEKLQEWKLYWDCTTAGSAGEGVLVFGKTPQATAWLNKQHQNGMMKKEYLAVLQAHQ